MRCHSAFATLLPLVVLASLAPADAATGGAPCTRLCTASTETDRPSPGTAPGPIDASAMPIACGKDPADTGGRTYGIVAKGRSDAVVRRCNVRGFRYGLYLADRGPDEADGVGAAPSVNRNVGRHVALH